IRPSLPDAESRERILEILLVKKGFTLEGITLAELAEMTRSLSGREIERFAKQTTAAMIAAGNEAILELVDEGLDSLTDYEIKVRPLSRAGFESARADVTPGVTPEDIEQFTKWREENA
ncbi:unnamed protein product, partial [marine sediment metagenome]